MAAEDMAPCEGFGFGHVPKLAGVDAPLAVAVGDVLFLDSLPPCCAQSALPYWAKVTGTISNSQDGDLFLAVSVVLLDAGGVPLHTYTDRVFVDAGETNIFEVKLLEFRHKAAGYRIEVAPAHVP